MTGHWPPSAEITEIAALMPLAVTLDRLKAQLLGERAVILLPPEVAPDVTGFMGHPVLRVPGLAQPMVGIPPETAMMRSMREFARDIDPPVSSGELDAIRDEWHQP